jgi:nucleoside 2-deoxyribosyltransferase
VRVYRLRRTRMKVYVASHCRWAALYVAGVLIQRGHKVTSRWHDEEFPTPDLTDARRRVIATEEIADVLESDAMVLIASPDKVPGGKFVEAGAAIGAGKRVIVIGRRENLLLWHPLVEATTDADEAAALLNG